MSLLQLDRVTKWYGDRTLFAGFSAQLAPGDRIALIGDNGTGKSTLLGILAEEIEPSEGHVQHGAGTRISHLPQVARLEGDASLYAELRGAFADLQAVEEQLRGSERTLSEKPTDRGAMQYEELLTAYERLGGYTADARIRAALAGVGFAAEDLRRSVSSLSGGERARAALARALVSAADVLLLDEPTNHLDFDGLDWLEAELSAVRGALVLVSHDRHLLDRTTNRTWEISGGRIRGYRVGYTHSRRLRNADRLRQRLQFDRQQAEAEEYREFIRRHRAGQKHRQAKDRERKLARLEENLVEAPHESRRIALDIQMGEQGGRRVAATQGFAVGFDRVLFRVPELVLERGDRVAIIGANGCGKTTLLRTIAGEHAAVEGTVSLGRSIRPAMFRQTQDQLLGDKPVLATLLDRTDLTPEEARSLLGRFLFAGDDVFKRTRDLSGGERSRVALALLSVMRGNLLLLDEPTNHLDLASQDVLERALTRYEGTVLLVSHDRALLEAVATQIWQVQDGQLRVHTCGFETFRERQRISDKDQAPPSARSRTRSTPASAPSVSDKRDRRRAAEALQAVEERIDAVEQTLDQIERHLLIATREGDAARIARLGAAHKEASETLNAHIAEWGKLASECETQAREGP